MSVTEAVCCMIRVHANEKKITRNIWRNETGLVRLVGGLGVEYLGGVFYGIGQRKCRSPFIVVLGCSPLCASVPQFAKFGKTSDIYPILNRTGKCGLDDIHPAAGTIDLACCVCIWVQGYGPRCGGECRD